MNSISSNSNGDSLPLEILQRLESSDSNFNLFQLMNQTYLSAFDIECHISDKFWTEVAEELWPKFHPTKMSERDFRPCQFVSTFGENFACKYYSHLWTDVRNLNNNSLQKNVYFNFFKFQMLATDLYEAFNEVGIDKKDKIIDVGIK